MEKRIIAIIPARGGSKGIPRKNVRLLNGLPLIAYSIKAAIKSKYINDVIVSTEDNEISLLAKKYGADVMERPSELASDEIPLDPVIHDVVRRVEKAGSKIDIVLTIQPTSPLIQTETIDKVIETLISERKDTVLTAIDDRHLSWTKKGDVFIPNYTERKNRQYLPAQYRETGAVLATRREFIRHNNRIGPNITLYQVEKYEGIDIDSPMDWWVAEKLLKRKKVLIRVDGFNEIGLGHIYRTLTLAKNIIEHEVIFLMNSKYQLGINMIEKNNFKIEQFEEDPLEKIKQLNPDIVINDILDTSKEYILALKALGIKVYNFEDLGEGAEFADGVFNALYPGSIPSESFYTGENYYCARNEFLNAPVKVISETVHNILITFGGTDPNNLTLKTLQAISDLKYKFNITIILGPGYSKHEELNAAIKKVNREISVLKEVENMADYMFNADIIFSSAGRTMYEIAIIGTPAIIIAQNYRELTHLFGHNYNGFINMGIHSEATKKLIKGNLERLIEDVELRKNMNKRMLKHDLRSGIDRVLSIIFDQDNKRC